MKRNVAYRAFVNTTMHLFFFLHPPPSFLILSSFSSSISPSRITASLLQRLRTLGAHEVGHTLGDFNFNFNFQLQLQCIPFILLYLVLFSWFSAGVIHPSIHACILFHLLLLLFALVQLSFSLFSRLLSHALSNVSHISVRHIPHFSSRLFSSLSSFRILFLTYRSPASTSLISTPYINN